MIIISSSVCTCPLDSVYTLYSNSGLSVILQKKKTSNNNNYCSLLCNAYCKYPSCTSDNHCRTLLIRPCLCYVCFSSAEAGGSARTGRIGKSRDHSGLTERRDETEVQNQPVQPDGERHDLHQPYPPRRQDGKVRKGKLGKKRFERLTVGDCWLQSTQQHMGTCMGSECKRHKGFVVAIH